ncbi:MAG: hypothetical protein WCJ93_09520 [Methanomicrobiales archaeon]
MAALTQHLKPELTPEKIAEDAERKKDPSSWRTPTYGTGRPCARCGSYQVNKVYVPLHTVPRNQDYICDSCHQILAINWETQKIPFPAPIVEQTQTPVMAPAPVKRSHAKKQIAG